MGAPGLWDRKIFGIRIWELALLFLFYFAFALAYNLAIYATSEGEESFLGNVLLDYGLKALYTIPIWWLVFRKLKHWKIWQKAVILLVILPLFVHWWQISYYYICDRLGLMHLEWPFAWWDVYLPGLFYVLQFGIYQVYDFWIRFRKQQELAGELRQIALQSELTALKAQLNPHFLYNTFNTISASVPAEQEGTREMIAKLSDLFRFQLRGTKRETVSLSEELEFVRTYLELEQARYGDRLRFRFDVPSELNGCEVPPMILQPIVENAVIHGISKTVHGGEVHINITRADEMLRIEVWNTGAGLPPALKMGVGLSNTQKRLNKMYGTDLKIEQEARGVVVTFEMPCLIE